MSTKLIGLDAGHGLKTAGKQTPDGIKEWTLNDKVRDFVVEFLKDYDVECIFTDKNEGNTDESLTARRTMYVNQKVDAFVSIHHNAYLGTWGNATGVEIYTDKNPTSKDIKLAEAIYKKLPNYTGLKGRGIKKANFTVINQSSIPAVLVEGGFMDSNFDYKIITSTEGQKAYAKAVAEGLIEFLELEKKVTTPTPSTTTTTTATTSSSTSTRSYLMKGDKGTEVKTMQENLIYMGYSCGKAGADGDFGSGTDTAVRAFQKANGLTVDGKYGAKSKEKLESLVANKKKAYTVTTSTYTHNQFVKDVQKAIGTTVDGIAGAKTLAKTPTISTIINRKHAVVKYIQKYLNSIGYDCGKVDGIVGAKFKAAVQKFQKANGCVTDGVISKKGKTWKKLLKMA